MTQPWIVFDINSPWMVGLKQNVIQTKEKAPVGEGGKGPAGPGLARAHAQTCPRTLETFKDFASSSMQSFEVVFFLLHAVPSQHGSTDRSLGI